MTTSADVAAARARDTLYRPDGPHPDDREYTTPDATACVLVDGVEDHAHVDADGPRTAAQLAELIEVLRRAQLNLEQRSRSRHAIDQHVEAQARLVADQHTQGVIRDHLHYASWAGRDDLEVRIWRRAAELHTLVEAPSTGYWLDLQHRGGLDGLLDTLRLVDAGTVRPAVGPDGAAELVVDLPDGRVRRCGPDSPTERDVEDLRADGMVHPHLLVTTVEGWAAVRLAARRFGAVAA